MQPLLLALDFGGTKHAAAITTPGKGEWVAMRRALSPPGASADTDLAVMRSLIHDLLNGAKPGAIGVSFGGPVDFTTGTVRLSHHVPGWEHVPLKQRLETEFGVPVWVDNDANVAALGEHYLGAGQGYDNLFYITVSTGVGGGWLLNGQPWRGTTGMAGEIGHTVVDPQAQRCLCGKRGCVERLASGAYIALDVREQLQADPQGGEILRQLVNHDLSAITGLVVSQAAEQGDTIALARLDLAAWALGVGIGNAANLINPQRFVLGGGVTKMGSMTSDLRQRFWNRIRETARQTALPEIEFDVVPAALEDEAPLWGAIALIETNL
jgi:glucokinase